MANDRFGGLESFKLELGQIYSELGIDVEDPKAFATFYQHHDDGQLAKAAGCYLKVAQLIDAGKLALVFADEGRRARPAPKDWPYEPEVWQPHIIAKNNVRKAGALLACEWNRLNWKFG
jgi:DNA polymerase IIIc chi subunit